MHPRCSIGGYFLDDLHNMPSFYEKPKHALEEELMPSAVKETASYLRLQLEYLHLQLMSLITNISLKELEKRPNLDLKSSIVGLEKTLDMMCEVTHRSPAMFLQSYTPLRVPSAARKVYEKVVQMHKRPEKLA